MAITGKWNLPSCGTMPTQNGAGTTSKNLYKNRYNVIGDRVVEVQDLIVHKFELSDVDDPILYAGEPLYNWQQSECGKWVMEHAVETPSWHQHANPMSFGHTFVIRARLKAKDATYFRLKWGNLVDTST